GEHAVAGRPQLAVERGGLRGVEARRRVREDRGRGVPPRRQVRPQTDPHPPPPVVLAQAYESSLTRMIRTARPGPAYPLPVARHAPTGTPALVALTRAGVAHTVHTYEHDPSTPAGYGLEAAQALGLPPEQVFKTLLADVDGRLV